MCTISGEEPRKKFDAMMEVVRKDPEFYRKAQAARWREWNA